MTRCDGEAGIEAGRVAFAIVPGRDDGGLDRGVGVNVGRRRELGGFETNVQSNLGDGLRGEVE